MSATSEEVSCPLCEDFEGSPQSVEGHISAKRDEKHRGRSGVEFRSELTGVNGTEEESEDRAEGGEEVSPGEGAGGPSEPPEPAAEGRSEEPSEEAEANGRNGLQLSGPPMGEPESEPAADGEAEAGASEVDSDRAKEVPEPTEVTDGVENSEEESADVPEEEPAEGVDSEEEEEESSGWGLIIIVGAIAWAVRRARAAESDVQRRLRRR